MRPTPNIERKAFSRSMVHILQIVQCPEIITDASSSIQELTSNLLL